MWEHHSRVATIATDESYPFSVTGVDLVLHGQTTFFLHGAYQLEIISACSKKGLQATHSHTEIPGIWGEFNWFHVTSGISYIEFFCC